MSRKIEAGRVGGVHPKDAKSMSVSGLGHEKPLVGGGWAISLVLSINR